MERLLAPARLLFGIGMLVSGLNHFVGPFLPVPTGTEPLAVQLMDALVFSRLLDVATAIQLVTGALILANLFLPLSLAVAMPVNICALYWALVLEGSLPWSTLAALAVGLGALLMFANLHNYAGMLARSPLALGEDDTNGGRYETLYARPIGHTSLKAFALALLPLLGAAAFYQYIVPSMLAVYCILVLAFPLGILTLRLVQYLLRDPQHRS